MTQDETIQRLPHVERRMCVLMIVASGYSSKHAAAILRVAKTTIDNDVNWWHARLQTHGRGQLVAVSTAMGLLSEVDMWFDGSAEQLAAYLKRRSDVDGDLLQHLARGGKLQTFPRER